MLLHTEAYTHRLLHTQKPLHTAALTHRCFYTQTLIHTDDCTHTEAFTHRSFDAQMLLHTHTGLFLPRPRSAHAEPNGYGRRACRRQLNNINGFPTSYYALGLNTEPLSQTVDNTSRHTACATKGCRQQCAALAFNTFNRGLPFYNTYIGHCMALCEYHVFFRAILSKFG